MDHALKGGVRRERTLGRDGGGGFVASTAQVRWLDPGTTLYRYVNSAHEPWGGWWFLQPMQGDPRVYAALPPDSSAEEMVIAVTKDRLDVLYGPGAPRCSNKPGGPDQVCVAWLDFHPTQRNRLTMK